jgi:hypothetical protein
VTPVRHPSRRLSSREVAVVRCGALDTVATPPGPWHRLLDRRALLIGAAVVVLGYLPLTALGPGTDLDVGGVHHAGRSILDGNYEVSRVPGAPVFEAAVGVLHAAGGSLLVNLGSAAMAVVTALALTRLLQREGTPHAEWYGLAVILNPFVWIAGTSMVDFLWATGLALTAANLQLSRRWVPAAVLYALAVGCRLSTLLLVGAFLLGHWWSERDDRRSLALTGLGVGGLVGLIFLAPYLQLGSEFLRSDVPTSSFLVQLGRFGVKNVFFFGPIVLALVLWHLPAVVRSTGERWHTSPVLRAGLVGLVATELLFLRFPWKLAHLVPSLLCLLLVLGASRALSGRLVAVLLVAQLVLGVVGVNVARPDRPNEATGGRLAVEILEGAWLRDLRCRLDGDRDAYRREGEVDALLETWACVVPWAD